MQIRMDKENRELKAHGSYEFPVNISYEQLSRYERGSFSWHWHPEIELTFVLSGQIGYQVNGKSYVLKEGDGIFCNTNALHSGHMIDGMDCVYISTTFAPRFLYGFSNSVIQTRYVEPVLTDMQLASIVFSPEIDCRTRYLPVCTASTTSRFHSRPRLRWKSRSFCCRSGLRFTATHRFPVNPRTRRQRVMLSGSAFCSTTSTAIIWSI